MMNRHDFVTRQIESNGGFWEPHVTKAIQGLLSPGDVVVDAGAHAGIHSRTMCDQGAEVHSFEPVSYNRTLLSMNVPEAIIHPEALSDTDGQFCIDYNLRAPFQSSNLGDFSIGRGYYLVNTVRLDSLELQPRFMKIDVQGAEIKLLEGARKTIEEHRPYIIIEIEEHQLQKLGASSGDLIKLLRSFDYTVFFLESEYPSEHLCVPNNEISGFRVRPDVDILAHTQDNEVNHNFSHGVNEKVVFNPMY